MSTTSNDQIAVFVGPTAYGAEDQLNALNKERFSFFPPIKRNDLSNLPSRYNIVVIVDGFFHAMPAVGHIEIRKALTQRTIYGCSSMGAIRAYEMHNLGMIGYGEVYRMFFQHEDFTDAELTQLLEPEPSFKPLTEPLVNLRYFIDQLLVEKVLSPVQAQRLLKQITNRYYGDLTPDFIRSALASEVGEKTADTLYARLPQYRIKTIDFIHLMKELDHD